jgi:hypothetical protein
MLRRVALVITDVLEECSASIIRVTSICELGTMLAGISNRLPVLLCSMCQSLVPANVVPISLILVTLVMNALHSSEMSVIIRATWHNIPKDGFLHSHGYENLKSCIIYCKLLFWTFGQKLCYNFFIRPAS